jgi:hypothetical protein
MTTPAAAADQARARGHRVENDGPTMGGAARYTCTVCGMAVLVAGAGHAYGSAIAKDCPGPRR